MKVYRGTLVHCLKPEATDVLSDHAIGFQEDESGKVVTKIISSLSRLL